MILFYLYTVVISIYKIGFQISRNAAMSIVDDHKATMKAPKARGTPWSERRKSRVDRFLAWQPKPETGFEKLDWINSNLQICWYRPFKIFSRTGSVRVALHYGTVLGDVLKTRFLRNLVISNERTNHLP